MDTRSVKKTMATDTALYLPAKAIEGILGIVIINVFTTYFFAPEIYSGFSFGTSLVNMVNLILMGWISQSSTRYVSHYQNIGEESNFLKTITVIWFIMCFSIIGLSSVILAFLSKWVSVDLYKMYMFMFIGYNMVQVLLPLLVFMRRIKLNLALSVGSNAMKLVLTCFLVLVLRNNHYTPAAALLGYGITDLGTALIVIFRLKLIKHFKKGRVSKDILKTLLTFSIPLLGVNITTALLNLSDRLIVKPLAGDGPMGIYAANYQIPGTVFPMISIGVMRGVYPVLLKNYRKEEPGQAAELLSQAIRYFLLLALPALTGLVSLSSMVSRVILDKRYFEGGFVISFVAAGVFCSSFVEFSNKAWEMSSNTKPIFRYSVISTALNLSMNILLIPVFGYRTAAVSTFLSFFLYLCLSVIGSRKKIRWYINKRSLMRMLLSCMIMCGYIYGMKQVIGDSLWSLIFLVLSGAAVYILVLFVSGELKDVTMLFWKDKKANN